MELERQNPHWEEGFNYDYELKRDIFSQLLDLSKSPWIVGMFGMRRVGKTTLLKQLINEYIKQGKRSEILYFSFDEEKADFWEVVREYERFLGRRVRKGDVLMFDEIQNVQGWAAKLKLLYDTSSPKIFITGSATSQLRKGGESLAGRFVELHVEPLSFKEFLRFRGKESLYEYNLVDAKENEYRNYLKKPFPEIVDEDKFYLQYTEGIAKKAIFEDIPSIFPVEDAERLWVLFSLIRSNPGLIADYSSLASDLGMSRVTVAKYVSYLEHAYMVRKLYNFSNNRFTSEKRLKKLYPYVPAFCDAEMPAVVECAVAFETQARFFWREKDRVEVDFITTDPLIAYEVKFKDNLNRKDFRGLESFLSKFGGEGYVITKKKMGLLNTIAYFELQEFLEYRLGRPKALRE